MILPYVYHGYLWCLVIGFYVRILLFMIWILIELVLNKKSNIPYKFVFNRLILLFLVLIWYCINLGIYNSLLDIYYLRITQVRVQILYCFVVNSSIDYWLQLIYLPLYYLLLLYFDCFIVDFIDILVTYIKILLLNTIFFNF